MGPICAVERLLPYMPSDPMNEEETGKVGAVAASHYSSANILNISYAYIRMMGAKGLRDATEVAILNANYIAKRLNPHYPVLYRGNEDLIAHECIIDIRPIKAKCGIEAEDIAKRLMDYGFHAPTMSWPVIGTMMIEPTESENLAEIDRFCDAMIQIREEIKEVEENKVDANESVLKKAPHTAQLLVADSWDRPYSREKAAYPLSWLREHKYWPPVGRIDNVWGDRNLFCTCADMSQFES